MRQRADMIMSMITEMTVRADVTIMITIMTMTTMITSIITITEMTAHADVMTMMTMITSMITSITTIMEMSAHVDVTTMIITIIMQMRYLQAGARRHLTSTMRISSERFLTPWLTQRSMALSYVQRELCLAMLVTGCTLILYQVSLRSERVRLISQESSV